METSIWRALFYLVGIMAFAALNAAYLVWCERKGAARIQRRSGPTEVGYEGLLQPLADGLKLMSKQLLVPRSVDGIIFRLAPVLAMIPGITSMVVIPFSGNIQARAMELSLLLIFALASLGMIAILLGGSRASWVTYGLVLLLAALLLGLVQLDDVKEVGLFLTGIFPLLFVPAAAGVMELWAEMGSMLLPIVIAIIPVTVLVLVSAGRTTQALTSRRAAKKEAEHD